MTALCTGRALLILGRVSNLPTVWSNCLAGWLLGGAGSTTVLPPLLIGASLLYIGGMFLNDAFDVEFDLQFHQERPIPSGEISIGTVWFIGCTLLLIGVAVLFLMTPSAGYFGLLLAACIVLYDWLHKRIAFAPVLMAACRFVLYLVAASTTSNAISGVTVWCAVALASYIVGLSYLARRESMPGALQYWPLVFLVFPILLALIINVGSYRNDALLVSALLAAWILRSIRYTLWEPKPQIGRTVAGLLAGIVWVDWLAVPYVSRELSVIFIALFFAALVFQRYVPAT
jgi:hypothetical protein